MKWHTKYGTNKTPKSNIHTQLYINIYFYRNEMEEKFQFARTVTWKIGKGSTCSLSFPQCLYFLFSSNRIVWQISIRQSTLVERETSARVFKCFWCAFVIVYRAFGHWSRSRFVIICTCPCSFYSLFRRGWLVPLFNNVSVWKHLDGLTAKKGKRIIRIN